MRVWLALLLLAAADPLAEPVAWPQAMLALQNRPQGLTADEAGRRAAETSAEAAAAEQNVARARAGVNQAGSAFVPEVELRLQAMRRNELGSQSAGRVVVAPQAPLGPLPAGATLVNAENGFPSLNRSYSAEARVTVPLSDYALRIARNYAAARHREESARRLALAEKSNRAAAAKLAYYRWAGAKLEVLVAGQLAQDGRDRLADVRYRRVAGSAAADELSRAEALERQAAFRLVAANNLHALEQMRLKTLLHADEAFELGEDVTSFPAAWNPGELDKLADEAVARRWEVLALESDSLAAERQADAARTAAWPRLVGFGNVIDGNPNPRYVVQEDEWNTTWEVGAALVWQPHELWRAGAEAAGLRAEGARLEAQRRALGDAVRLEVWESLTEWTNAEAGLLPAVASLRAAEERRRVGGERVRAGKATEIDLLEADSALTQARVDLITAIVRIKSARVALLHAVGRE